MKTINSPGVYVPPPMVYAAFFGLAALAQANYPIELQLFKSDNFHIAGWALIVIAIGVLLPSLLKFWRTKNTLIPFKPANSLQTSGIYAYTRNPMYLGLLFLYIGLACLFGNCWTLIFLPFLFLVIQSFIILPEERYLDSAFSEEYKNYKDKVRRWI